MDNDQFMLAINAIKQTAAINRIKYSNLDTTKLEMKLIDEYEFLTWLVGYDQKVILDVIPVNFELHQSIANIYYIY